MKKEFLEFLESKSKGLTEEKFMQTYIFFLEDWYEACKRKKENIYFLTFLNEHCEEDNKLANWLEQEDTFSADELEDLNNREILREFEIDNLKTEWSQYYIKITDKNNTIYFYRFD